jgi:DNA-binding NarL/FixJ family response regulator
MRHSFCVLLGEPNPLLAEKSAGIAARHDQVWCVVQVLASCGLERAASALHPELILSDLTLLQPAGMMQTLRTASPRSRIVALVESLSEPYVSAVRRLGVDHVVEKQALPEVLQSELRRLAVLASEDDESQPEPPASAGGGDDVLAALSARND